MNPDPTQRRTGRYRVPPDVLMAALDLPADTSVLHVIPDCDPVGITLVVEHEDLDPVPPGAESPPIGIEQMVATTPRGGTEIISSRWKTSGFSTVQYLDPNDTGPGRDRTGIVLDLPSQDGDR